MMISRFNGILVSNMGNQYSDFSFIETTNKRLVVEYTTGERSSLCFRHYDETERDQYFYPVIDIDWIDDDNWWIEVIHQHTTEGYYHGVLVTNGNNATVIAIITPNNHMWVVGDNEEIDLS